MHQAERCSSVIMNHFLGNLELDCFIVFILCKLFDFFLIFDMSVTLFFFCLQTNDELISFNCLSSYLFLIKSYFIDVLYKFVIFGPSILYYYFLIYSYFIYFFSFTYIKLIKLLSKVLFVRINFLYY